jgi:circadian clock protein KaiC
MAEDTLVRTGITGLDDLLLGGIPRTNVILVEGGVGTGKTLFGVEFIYQGITEFNEPGIIVVFETSPGKLIRDAATMGWDLPALQAEKKLHIVFTSPQVIEQELRSADSLGHGRQRSFPVDTRDSSGCAHHSHEWVQRR